MIDKMIAGLVPILLQRVAVVPMAEKMNFVKFIVMMCNAYLENDKPLFVHYLAETSFPTEWKAALTSALWP